MRDAWEFEGSIAASFAQDCGARGRFVSGRLDYRCSSRGTRLWQRFPIEKPAPSSNGFYGRRLWLVDIAGFLFAVSMHKYAVRDGLSANTGIQGIIEFGCIIGAFLFVLSATWGQHRRYSPSIPSICFAIFGLFALASSWRSFYPILSFAKGTLLLVVLATGYLASQAGLGRRYLRAVYRSYALSLAVGLIVGIILPHIYPLFSVDEYSGRTVMSVFDTFFGVVGEDAALMLLLAPVVSEKPSWIACILLLVVNILAGGKTSTALLLLLLTIRLVYGICVWRRWGAVVFISGIAAIGALAMVATLHPEATFHLFARSAVSIYGNQVGAEATGLDGRLGLWKGAISLLPTVPLLGYGFGGARDFLLKIAIWSGSSHNGYLEMALSGGILGFLFFVVGLCSAIQASLGASLVVRLRLLSVLAFILSDAITGGIFDNPSFVGFLVLVCVPYFATESSVPAGDFYRLLAQRRESIVVVPAT
jgi:O-antigen ligase